MAPNTPDRPGVIAFPPLLYAATLGVGLLLHYFVFPRQIIPLLPARILGAVLMVAGAGIAKWGEATMRRRGTNVDPRQPSLAIVAEGPFRVTRNPLYLGLIAIYCGVALAVDATVPFVLLPVLLAVTHYGIIRREERYLERKFGRSYLVYKASVRRYL